MDVIPIALAQNVAVKGRTSQVLLDLHDDRARPLVFACSRGRAPLLRDERFPHAGGSGDYAAGQPRAVAAGQTNRARRRGLELRQPQ